MQCRLAAIKKHAGDGGYHCMVKVSDLEPGTRLLFSSSGSMRFRLPDQDRADEAKHEAGLAQLLLVCILSTKWQDACIYCCCFCSFYSEQFDEPGSKLGRNKQQ
jgi:hypothetical protein